MKALESKLAAAQVAFDSFVAAQTSLGDTPRTEETPSCKKRPGQQFKNFKEVQLKLTHGYVELDVDLLLQQTCHCNLCRLASCITP